MLPLLDAYRFHELVPSGMDEALCIGWGASRLYEDVYMYSYGSLSALSDHFTDHCQVTLTVTHLLCGFVASPLHGWDCSRHFDEKDIHPPPSLPPVVSFVVLHFSISLHSSIVRQSVTQHQPRVSPRPPTRDHLHCVRSCTVTSTTICFTFPPDRTLVHLPSTLARVKHLCHSIGGYQQPGEELPKASSHHPRTPYSIVALLRGIKPVLYMSIHWMY